MPWSAEDAPEHTKKADSPAKRRKWAAIANGVLKDSGDKAKAIRIANSQMESVDSLFDRVFVEDEEGEEGKQETQPTWGELMRRNVRPFGNQRYSPSVPKGPTVSISRQVMDIGDKLKSGLGDAYNADKEQKQDSDDSDDVSTKFAAAKVPGANAGIRSLDRIRRRSQDRQRREFSRQQQTRPAPGHPVPGQPNPYGRRGQATFGQRVDYSRRRETY